MSTGPLYKEFGRLVRGRRKRLKLTQDQLAEQVGLSRTSITNIEQGRQKVLLHQLFQIAASLSISPADLLPWAVPPGAQPLLEQKLKELKGPEKDWARQLLIASSKEGGVSSGKPED